MQIEILQGIEGAKEARGLAVIIDVFRAFSTACYAVSQGAKMVIPVGKKEIAYKLKELHPDYVLMGERHGIILPNFDHGNSPSQIQGIDFANKNIIQTTSAGTQGFANAIDADSLIAGSFVNANAIVSYIEQINPERLSLVAMGRAGIEEAAEDTALAHYLHSRLKGKAVDFNKLKEELRVSAGGKFFDPEQPQFPQYDFDCCLKLDAFDFVLCASKYDDQLLALRPWQLS